MAGFEHMLLRIVSALVLVPVVLALVVLAGPGLLLAALGLLGTLCLYEYFALVRRLGLQGQPCLGYAAFWIMLVASGLNWLPATAILPVVLIAVFLAALWSPGAMRERTLGMMATFFGILYVGLTLLAAHRIRFEFGRATGLQWMLMLLAVVWMGDTAAMLAGKTFGRTLFSPRISPKKTNEGAIAGLLAGVVTAVILQAFLFVDLPRLHVLASSVLVGVFAQLGDLAESLLKRAAETKDSSHLIPGHGGVLDRVDSLLFAFPVLYVYLLILY
jgi:phosphatidate cytidylyltransferase